MKETTLYIIGLILILSSCGKNIGITGELDGGEYNFKTVYLYAIASSDFNMPILLSTTEVSGGTFSFSDIEKHEVFKEGNLPTIGFVTFIDQMAADIDESMPMATIIIEEGDIKVVFDKNSIILSGTERNIKFNNVHQAITNIVEFAYLVNDAESIDGVPVNVEGKDGRAQFQELNHKLNNETYEFASANMNNNAGQFLFLKSYADNIFTPQQIKNLIEKSSDAFRNNEEVAALKKILDEMEVGSNLSVMDDNEFDLGDIDSETIGSPQFDEDFDIKLEDE